MILYNVTINIEQEVEDEWIQWMKEVHVPNVMATGIFQESKFFRILHETDDNTANYSVQYFTDSMEKIKTYQSRYAPQLQAEVKEKFQDRFVSFRSLLESVE
jgi:hypothetical protein